MKKIILSCIALFVVIGVSVLTYYFVITPHLRKQQAEEAFSSVKKTYQYANNGDYDKIQIDPPTKIGYQKEFKDFWDILTHKKTIISIDYDSALISKDRESGMIFFKLSFKNGEQKKACHTVSKKYNVWKILIVDPLIDISTNCENAAFFSESLFIK